MKLECSLWMIICIVGALTLGLFAVAMAQDQNPPEGKDKGVWILVEKKPELEKDKDWDNGAYYNNHVSLSGTTIQGGYSWKDGNDPKDCKGNVKGSVSWNEPPSILEPGVEQETTITAEASGDQSCSARHPGAYASLAINDAKLEPHPKVDFSSGDMKQDSVTSKVSWEAPWGKIGESFKISIFSKVPGSVYANVNYVYTYEANAQTESQSSTSMAQDVPDQIDTRSSVTFDPTQLKPRTGAYIKDVLAYSEEDIEVYVIRNGDKIPAKKGFQLRAGDVIQTGAETTVTIEMPFPPNYHKALTEWGYGDSMRSIDIGFNSKIEIHDETEHDTTEKEAAEGLELLAGWIGEYSGFDFGVAQDLREKEEMVKEQRLYPPASYYDEEKEEKKAAEFLENWASWSMKPYAYVSHVNTRFVCERKDNAAILKVLEGSATFTSYVTGDAILVNAGQMATANGTGLSTLEPFDVNAEKAKWEKLRSSTTQGGPDTGGNNQNPDLSGTWEGAWNNGYLGQCQLLQSGDSLQFINENGQTSSGKFIDSETVVASDWEGGLIGHITQNGNRIDWENGSWWER